MSRASRSPERVVWSAKSGRPVARFSRSDRKPVGAVVSGCEIEYQHLGIVSVGQLDPALCLQQQRISCFQLLAIDLQCSEREMNVGLSVWVQRQLGVFGAIEQTGVDLCVGVDAH